MLREAKERVTLAFRNPNKAWVVAELDKLHTEWLAWGEHAKSIPDHVYDKNSKAECFADGEENMHKHDILREKTLVFLDNNIQGHDFMRCQSEGRPFEIKSARLRVKVPHRLHELEILKTCLQYAEVPEGFWKEQGKKLVKKLAEVAPDKAADVAASWLRNPAD